jgi:hypothetical protein
MFVHRTESLPEIFGSTPLSGRPLRRGDLFPSGVLARDKFHETFRVTPEDGIDLPNVIIPALGNDEDLYATIATYYQSLSPISALTHVLGEETKHLLDRRPNNAMIEGKRSNRTACLGIAVGEAVLAGLGANDSTVTPTYAACRRTLAFSLCRTQLIFQSSIGADTVASRWIELRKLTGLSVSSHSVQSVLAAIDHSTAGPKISEFAFIEPTVSKCLKTLAKDSKTSGLLLSTMIHLYPGTKRFASALDGPFDGRMSAFTQLVDAIQSTPRGTHTDEIAVAFFCNLIQPGSFAHVKVLAALVDFYPAALVWYGYFCGVAGRTAMQGMDSGLITKLERDLLASFSFESRPECDISFEELQVLSRIKLRAESIKPSHQRAILVGLLPGVNVLSRFDSESEPSTDRSKLRLEVEQAKANGRISRLLEEALHLLNRPAQPIQNEIRTARTAANRRKNPDR